MKTRTRLFCLFLICLLLNIAVMPPVFAESSSGSGKELKGDVTPHSPQIILSGESNIPVTKGQEKSWLWKHKWWVLLGAVVVGGGIAAAAVGGGNEDESTPPSANGGVTVGW